MCNEMPLHLILEGRDELFIWSIRNTVVLSHSLYSKVISNIKLDSGPVKVAQCLTCRNELISRSGGEGFWNIS